MNTALESGPGRMEEGPAAATAAPKNEGSRQHGQKKDGGGRN